MRARSLVVIAFALTTVTLTTGCGFEQCCMRPTTGLYDLCFATAVPTQAAVRGADARARPEVGPPAASPAAAVAR